MSLRLLLVIVIVEHSLNFFFARSRMSDFDRFAFSVYVNAIFRDVQMVYIAYYMESIHGQCVIRLLHLFYCHLSYI
jgi:hypothetical protein